jgi:hypothetical protein
VGAADCSIGLSGDWGMTRQAATQTNQQASAMSPLSRGGILQRKCEECGQHTIAGGECGECGKKKIGLQRKLTIDAGDNGHDFSRVRVHTGENHLWWNRSIQRFHALNSPNDLLEQEADRTADRVISYLSSPKPAVSSERTGDTMNIVQRSGCVECEKAEENEPITSSSSVLHRIQRQADPDEDAANAAAAAAMSEPEVEGNNEELDDVDEVLQAKRYSAASTLAPADVTGQVVREIEQTRSNGQPLATPIRAQMEAGFSADFSNVRLHTDSNAARLAHSIQALAFTSGRDIFFGAGRYEPGSATGQRLLAHELTHVIQQGVAPASRQIALSSAIPGLVQLDPIKLKKTLILGEFHFFNAKGDNIYHSVATQASNLGISPGYYEIKLTPGDNDIYHVQIVGGGRYQLTPTKEGLKVLKRTNKIFLLVYSKPGDRPADKPTEAPSAQAPTGSAGAPQPDVPLAGGLGAQTAEPNNPTDIEKRDPSGSPSSKPGGAHQSDSKDDTSTHGKDGSKGLTGTEGSKTDDKSSGETPGKKTKGSKYGVFGLFDLPQPLIDFLEGALDVLGDSAEMEAMSETLRMLKDLAEHRDALAEMFKDSTILLEIALGLKDSSAVKAIENWVAKDVKAPKKSKNPSRKGIAAIATKLVAMVGKLRKVLKPVFKVRNTVQSAVGGVGLMLEAVPALETLLDMAGDPSKLPDLNLQAAIDEFAVDFAGQLKPKLDLAPKLLREGFERFSESDLVTYEELARAVTAAILTSVPKVYKPVVKVGKELGLDGVIADHLIAPIIPKDSLDGINDVIRSLIKLMQPTIDAGANDLQKIIDELAPGFLNELPQEVRAIIKPSRRVGQAQHRSSPRKIAGLIGKSAGTPMDEDLNTDTETRMGHLFSDVRLHTDSAAAEASDLLHANAFAVGNDVYFGAGKFNPASSDGRQLLYHELMHTVQQQSHSSLSLQADYKDLLRRLAKRFSASVITELKGATATSPSKQKQITEIKNKVSKLIGRKVESHTNPMLPTGYMYIFNNKGKIKTIRRTVAWIRFLPALKLDSKGIIRLAATLSKYDPKAPARKVLRAALGCTKNKEAHHIIPLELFLHPVAQVAVKNGFKFNGSDNGECISNNIHSGSHPIYTADVRSRLDRLEGAFTSGTDWTKLQKPFEKEIEKLHSELKLRRKKLK